MKRIIFALVIVLFTTEAFTQTNMVVRTKTGTYTAFSISDIDRIDFAPCGIVDYGGQTYYTVKIGDQCWFAQNLNIGTRINGSGNQTNNNPNYIEKYCYNDLDANCTTYGGLYQWDEAMQYVTTEPTQGICPDGWHIPTIAEFTTLKTEVGSDGNALKAIDEGTGSGEGTNTSGFSALLAGSRYYDSSFDYLGSAAYFWSSTEGSSTNAGYLGLHGFNSSITLSNNLKTRGFSVRCLKD